MSEVSDTPKQKGNVSESIAEMVFTWVGHDVYLPKYENTRCDMIVDVDDALKRIQVKTARNLDDSKIEFSCTSTKSNYTSEVEEKDYKGDVDAFVVVYQDQDEEFDDLGVYYVPIDDATRSKMILRLEPTKNGQTSGINMAEDYRFEDRFDIVPPYMRSD